MKEVRHVYVFPGSEMVQQFKMVIHDPVVAPLTGDIHQNFPQQELPF
jgi:hypothetical protein